MKKIVFITLWLGIVSGIAHPDVQAQPKPLSLQDCIDIALKQNLSIKSDSLGIAQDKVLRKTAFDPGKTSFSLLQDPTEGGSAGNAIEITQSFDWPAVYTRQKKVLTQQSLVSEKAKVVTESDIIRAVKLNFYHYRYQVEKLKVLRYLDSIYADYSAKANLRARTGETSHLEVLSARSKLEETQLLQKEARADREQYALALQELLNAPQPVELAVDSFTAIAWHAAGDSLSAGDNPSLDYLRQQTQLASARVGLEKAKLWPDLVFGYGQQFLVKGFNPANIDRKYFPGTYIGGFRIGIGLPLFMGPFSARIRAEKIGVVVAENQLEQSRLRLQTAWQQALNTYNKYSRSLGYYRLSGLTLAEEQLRVAQLSFDKGEIGYVEFIQSISQAAATKLNYLSALNSLNEAIIHLQYLQGNLR